ncbi:MAG: cupin domain-containing protein [Proteobacteria bacterium]|nr:cupin domain-containing protein [Pseudomonadota bacterium]
MSKRVLCIANSAALVACSPVLVADEDLPDPLAAGWNGEQICELLHEDAHQRILRCTFPPGVGHEKHFHKAHFGYVLAGGKMRIVDDSGEREVDLQADYSWTSDGVSWHEVLNVGETTSVYLIVESF